jgi:hypothetical protein
MEGEHLPKRLLHAKIIGKEKWEDQNQYAWMKLMETQRKWVYYCGGEELQVEKSGGNSYLKPRIFLSCRAAAADDDDDDDFVFSLLKAL